MRLTTAIIPTQFPRGLHLRRHLSNESFRFNDASREEGLCEISEERRGEGNSRGNVIACFPLD